MKTVVLTLASALSALLLLAATCCTFELDLWLDGVPEEALKLQRPAPLELLTIVSHGPREDRS